MKDSNYESRQLYGFDTQLDLDDDFYTKAYAVYDELLTEDTCWEGDNRLLFRKYIEDVTGIYSYYPTDWALSVKYGVRNCMIDREEFVAALYGVTLLALNSRWYSEVNDCPEEWYEKKRVADADAQNQDNL